MVNLRLVPVFQSLLIQSFSKTNQSAVAEWIDFPSIEARPARAQRLPVLQIPLEEQTS